MVSKNLKIMMKADARFSSTSLIFLNPWQNKTLAPYADPSLQV